MSSCKRLRIMKGSEAKGLGCVAWKIEEKEEEIIRGRKLWITMREGKSGLGISRKKMIWFCRENPVGIWGKNKILQRKLGVWGMIWWIIFIVLPAFWSFFWSQYHYLQRPEMICFDYYYYWLYDMNFCVSKIKQSYLLFITSFNLNLWFFQSTMVSGHKLSPPSTLKVS